MILKSLLLIGSGGFLGSIARFLMQLWVVRHINWVFPLATFLVNLSGCLLIGILWGLNEKPSGTSYSWRLFLATGFCGGFTTFSTFSLENLGLLRQGQVSQFFLYSSLSLAGCLLAVAAGYFLAKRLLAF